MALNVTKLITNYHTYSYKYMNVCTYICMYVPACLCVCNDLICDLKKRMAAVVIHAENFRRLQNTNELRTK